MNPSFAAEDVAGREGPNEGPDYLALVIEWGNDGENTVPTVSASAPESSAMMLTRKIATLVSALGAIALATWGLRRLRAVS